MNYVSSKQLKATFSRVKFHRLIGHIISRYSTNKKNIYRLALNRISFKRKISVLDLGCGYGLFTSQLGGITQPGSTCTGIDFFESNREPFLKAAGESRLKGHFLCDSADCIRKFPSQTFELILSGYSLYYFVEILPHITRVLTRDGWFVAITHSEFSLNEFLADFQNAFMNGETVNLKDFGIKRILSNFSSENGVIKLQPYFEKIEQIGFPNQLIFPAKNIQRCIYYLDFIRPSLLHNLQYRDTVQEQQFIRRLHEIITKKALREGHYILNKNDAIFRCRHPKAIEVTL